MGGSESTGSGADPAVMIREKRRAALASVLAGVGLTVMKLAAGLATGSLGILAEAAHSGLDTVAAALTLFAVKTSWRPPDAEHHYGHGKVENLTALAEAALLVVTSFWIIQEALGRMIHSDVEVEPNLWAFLVIGVSIAVDIVRARDLRDVARRSKSQALEADALHFSTDIASSGVVLLGLVGVLVARRYDIPGLGLADSVAAMLVAVIVLILCWRLGRRSIDALMDRAPQGMMDQVRLVLAGIGGVSGEPRIRLRQAGDRIFADIELGMAAGLPLAEGERVAELAREKIREVLGRNASVLIQLRGKRGDTSSLRQQVATVVAMEGVHGHNITVRKMDDGAHVDLHLELPGEMSLEEGHAIADRVEVLILRRLPEISRVDIHLELYAGDPDRATPLDRESREWMERRVHEVSAEIIGEGAVHDLLMIRTESGLYLSCHCFLSGGTPLREAHRITDRLEKALYQAFPELNRVSVHAEPDNLRS